MKLPWESQNPWYFYGSALILGFILSTPFYWLILNKP